MATATIATHEPKSLPPIQIPPRYLAFSDSELAAAEQLVQLSSSCDSGGEAGAPRSLSSCCSSLLSVGSCPPAPPSAEEDEDACVGPQRRTHRYRQIVDIYMATKPIVLPKKRYTAQSGCGRKKG